MENKDLCVMMHHPEIVPSFSKYLENIYGYFKENYETNNDVFYEGVVLGASYANSHPSDDLIKRIMQLSYDYMESDVELNNLSLEGEFEYIKTHLNDE